MGSGLASGAAPHGQSARLCAALYTFQRPGLYVYLNHNLIDAVLKGAAAHVKVEGEWNNDLLEQIKEPTPIQ